MNICICEWIRMGGLRWFGLHAVKAYPWWNIYWREGLISRQRIKYVVSSSIWNYTHNSHARDSKDGRTPLMISVQEKADFPVVEYLVQRGAVIEEKDAVSDIMSLMPTHASVTHEHMCRWMYQYGRTPLMWAAMNGQLPAVEYLVERGGDIETKDDVRDVISSMWSHTYVTHEYYM